MVSPIWPRVVRGKKVKPIGSSSKAIHLGGCASNKKIATRLFFGVQTKPLHGGDESPVRELVDLVEPATLFSTNANMGDTLNP